MVVDNNCVSGASHFDPEGAVLANDGLETAYCLIDGYFCYVYNEQEALGTK